MDKRAGEMLLDYYVNKLVKAWRYRKSNKPIAKLEDTFRLVGLKNSNEQIPNVSRYHRENENTIVSYWNLPLGVSYQQIVEKSEVFNDSLKAYCEIEQTKKGEFKVIISEGEIPKFMDFDFNPSNYPKMTIPVPIGYTADGNLFVVDLIDIVHIKTGGPTGTGKSNWLHTVAASLAMNEKVQLFIIDMALLEFAYMKDHCIFGSELDEAVNMLEFLEKEVHRRRKILFNAGVEKIQKYQGDDMPYIVLMVDEYSFLIPDGACGKEEKEIKEHAQGIISRLGRLARKVGIHLILATQRPSKETMPGHIKSNFDGSLALRTVDAINSKIIIDSTDAAYLPNVKGRAIWKWGNEKKEVQIMCLPLEESKKIIADIPPKRLEVFEHAQRNPKPKLKP